MSDSVKDIKELKLYLKALQPDIKDMLSTNALKFFRKPADIDKIDQTIIKILEESSLKGSINGISVASFMQLIEMEQKKCCIRVDSHNIL